MDLAKFGQFFRISLNSSEFTQNIPELTKNRPNLSEFVQIQLGPLGAAQQATVNHIQNDRKSMQPEFSEWITKIVWS